MVFVTYRPGERAYTAEVEILDKDDRRMVLLTPLGISIRMELMKGSDFEQYNDQGYPARVRVFQDEKLVIGDGNLLLLSAGVWLVVHR